MPTSIQVHRETLDLLKRLKAELRTKTYDEAIRKLLARRRRTPRSLFGADPRLRPFVHEKEFHAD